jgi:hypothetical protein
MDRRRFSELELVVLEQRSKIKVMERQINELFFEIQKLSPSSSPGPPVSANVSSTSTSEILEPLELAVSGEHLLYESADLAAIELDTSHVESLVEMVSSAGGYSLFGGVRFGSKELHEDNRKEEMKQQLDEGHPALYDPLPQSESSESSKSSSGSLEDEKENVQSIVPKNKIVYQKSELLSMRYNHPKASASEKRESGFFHIFITSK